MRVIAGEAKGRRLTGLRSPGLRPTTDRVREALFSTLGRDVAGARVLDLFAGSGALGIEALSRGARSAVFVDHDKGALDAIRANLELTRMADRATVVPLAAERFVASVPAGSLDLVLMDPPYAMGVPVEILQALVAGGALAPGAQVVLETGAPLLEGDAPSGLEVVRQRRYGDSTLVFLVPVSSEP